MPSPADLNHSCPICKKEMPSRNLPRHVLSHKKHLAEFMHSDDIKHCLDKKMPLIYGDKRKCGNIIPFIYCLSCGQGKNEFSKQLTTCFYSGSKSHIKESPQCFTSEKFEEVKKFYETPGKIMPKTEEKKDIDISDTNKKFLENLYTELHKPDEGDEDEDDPFKIPDIDTLIGELISSYKRREIFIKKRNAEIQNLQTKIETLEEKIEKLEETNDKFKIKMEDENINYLELV